MALMESDIGVSYRHRGAKAYTAKAKLSAVPHDAKTENNTLTFVTTDGESIVFNGMDVSVEVATATASEDALGKIWNRPAEDLAWRDM